MPTPNRFITSEETPRLDLKHVPIEWEKLHAGLRRCAFVAVNQLANVRLRQLPQIVGDLLKLICQKLDAVDTHLFRVRWENQQPTYVGLRYQSGNVASDADLNLLRKFRFPLLSAEVQECLLNRQIAVLHKDAPGAGRLLNGLMKRVACESYILIPISDGKRTSGMLGVATRTLLYGSEPAEFFELLKLNGGLLLTSVTRVKREHARRRKLAAWRRVADQSCDFAIRISPHGEVTDTIAFGAGDNVPLLKGLRVIDIVPGSFQRELKKQVDRAVSRKEVRTCDFQLLLGSDGPRWYVARIEPGNDSSNAYATLYLTDNNPDKVLEEEVRLMTDQLLKASRMSLLGQMSTEFAHQLNQPLQAILNYCNMMQRRVKKGTDNPDKTLQALNNIEQSVMHSASIIQRIRDFVKFQSLKTESVMVDDLIDQALMMILPTARAADSDVLSPAALSGIRVLVDKTQTTHVLINLMVNALEACQESGVPRPRIEIRVTHDTARCRVIVSVKDNGPGLPKTDPEIVFRKFYSSKSDGLGMGLAISKDVCESQGGSLHANNNANEPGCTFWVTLPAQPDPGTDTTEIPVIRPETQ